MTIKNLFWATMVMACISVSGCQSTDEYQLSQGANQLQPLPIRPDVQQYQLDNGLRVILQPRRVSGVEMRLLVHSGSLQETESQRGLAHFVEHMAFKGTKNFPSSDSFKKLEKQGISLGSHINAITSFDSTVYKLSLPNADSSTVELGLTILSDWASNISFEESAFESEREVIVEEWRLRQGVGTRINDQLEALRYQGSRLAERNPIGLIDVVRHAPVSDAKAYYQKWYQPQRMTLVISGWFDDDEIRTEIEHLFASIARGDTPADPQSWQAFPSSDDLRVAPIFDSEQSGRIIQFALQQDIVTPINSVQGQWQETLDSLWLAVLKQRMDILVAHEQLTGVRVPSQSQLISKQRLQFLFIAQPIDGDYQRAFLALATEVQRLAAQPVSESELKLATEQLLTKLRQQAKYHQKYENAYLADQLVQSVNHELPMLDKPQQLQMTEVFLESLTASELQKHVSKLVDEASLTLAVIGPDTDAKANPKAAFKTLWLQTRQATPGPFELTKPEFKLQVVPQGQGEILATTEIDALDDQSITEYQLSNGLKVVVLSNPQLRGGSQIDLRLQGGSSLDPDAWLGAVSWSAKLPELCGYGDYSAHQIRQWSETNKIRVAPYTEMLYHGYKASSREASLNSLLGLLHLKMTQAKFCDDKLIKMKQSTRHNLSKVPVERKFMDAITEASLVNGYRLVNREEGSWNQFTVEQLQGWHQQLYGNPKQMVVTIVTDQPPAEVEPMLARWLASLPERSVDSLTWIDRGILPKSINEKRSYDIATSNKAMVQLQYSREFSWSLKHHLQLQLLESITNNRLRERVRVMASGVYVISMSQMLVRDPSSYYLGRLNFTTAPERADELSSMANSVILRLRDKGVSAQELRQAKQAWSVNSQQMQQYSDYWVSALSQDVFSEEPYLGLQSQQQIIDATSIEELNQLARAVLGHHLKQYVLRPMP